MKKAHVRTSLHAFLQEQVPSLEHCRHCKWQFLQLSQQSAPSHFFLFPQFFIPSSQSPGGVCGQLALPQWCGDFLGLPSWGQAPLWAPHTWLGGLPDLDLAPWRLVSFAQGKACMPLSPRQWERVWGHFFRRCTCHLVLQTYTHALVKCSKHMGAQKVMKIYSFFFHFQIRICMLFVSEVKWKQRLCFIRHTTSLLIYKLSKTGLGT